VKTDPPRSIQNGKCLDFGWRNFQLVDHEKFFKAGCAGAGDVDTSLKVQKTHSDHRRKVQKGLFSGADRFNMEHKQWSSADEWREAAKEMDDVSPPTRTESGPMSFLGAFMPKTAIMITPKGQKVGSGCVSTPLKLGCFIAFGGQVLLLLFLNLQTTSVCDYIALCCNKKVPVCTKTVKQLTRHDFLGFFCIGWQMCIAPVSNKRNAFRYQRV
jgi:hypothetical protein